MQLQCQLAAMPACVAISAQRVAQPFTPSAALQNELGADVVRQVKCFTCLRKNKFLRREPIWIVLGAVLNREELQLRRVLNLNHEVAAKRHIQACRVEQFFVVRDNHATGEA